MSKNDLILPFEDAEGIRVFDVKTFQQTQTLLDSCQGMQYAILKSEIDPDQLDDSILVISFFKVGEFPLDGILYRMRMTHMCDSYRHNALYQQVRQKIYANSTKDDDEAKRDDTRGN